MRTLLFVVLCSGCANVVNPEGAEPAAQQQRAALTQPSINVLAAAHAAVAAAEADRPDAFRAAVEPLVNDPNAILALVARAQQPISDDDRTAILSTANLAIRAYAAAPVTGAFGRTFDPTGFFLGLRAMLPTLTDVWLVRGLEQSLKSAGAP